MLDTSVDGRLQTLDRPRQLEPFSRSTNCGLLLGAVVGAGFYASREEIRAQAQLADCQQANRLFQRLLAAWMEGTLDTTGQRYRVRTQDRYELPACSALSGPITGLLLLVPICLVGVYVVGLRQDAVVEINWIDRYPLPRVRRDRHEERGRQRLRAALPSREGTQHVGVPGGALVLCELLWMA